MNRADAAAAAVDERLVWQHLSDLAMLGSSDDPVAGITRLALTSADIRGRMLVESWLREYGCDVTRDRIGNTFGTLTGTDPGLPPVLLGSHIDSVVGAGRFDGCLGVVGAAEVLRVVALTGRPRRSLVAVVFTDEEGARFGRDLLGSSVACGHVGLPAARAMTDTDGTTVGAELDAHDLPGDRPWLHQAPPHAYVETHIEQGPVLDQAGRPVGCVTGVVGTVWLTVDIDGTAAHAGATPMTARRDAGLAAAELRLRLHGMALDRPGLTLAVGVVRLHPGMVNVVPGRASMIIDIRSADETTLHEAERTARGLAEQAASAHGCTIARADVTSRTSPVAFDPAMVDLVGAAVETRTGAPPIRLTSGAGHDAQQVATVCPTAMIFVRSRNDGASHSSDEWSTPEDCTTGIQVMTDVALTLAQSD